MRVLFRTAYGPTSPPLAAARHVVPSIRLGRRGSHLAALAHWVGAHWVGARWAESEWVARQLTSPRPIQLRERQLPPPRQSATPHQQPCLAARLVAAAGPPAAVPALVPGTAPSRFQQVTGAAPPAAGRA